MSQIKLIGGFYQARSPIANAQRCVNLYPEKNPEDGPFPYTQYPTPGLTWLAQGPTGVPWRGLYLMSTGKLIGVLGNNVYYIDSSWNLNLLGHMASLEDFGVSLFRPVSIFENGLTAVIVDGSHAGYTVDVNDLNFGTVDDDTGLFVGATRVDYIDTFFLFNQPNSRNFYSSLSNELVFDPLFVAAKTVQPDLLQTIVAVHREFLLIGQRTTEAWFDAGAANFPFQIVPGVFMEQGTPAPYSPQKHDLEVLWLTDARTGRNSVVIYSGYALKKVSTSAISNAIRNYNRKDDAVGIIYKQADHIFYALTFPTEAVANSVGRTWVFDLNEALWHERTSIDPATGLEGRWRVNCVVEAYDTVVAGDFINGKLYALDLENPTEDGVPIVRRRGLPHITTEGRYLEYGRVRLDIETGTAQDSQAPVLDITDLGGTSTWTANTLRQVIIPTDFRYTGPARALSIRLFAAGSTTAGAQILAAYVGPQGTPNPWNFDGTQQQLTFKGSGTFTFNGGSQSMQSDPVALPFNPAVPLVIAIAFDGGNAVLFNSKITAAYPATSATYSLAGNDAAGNGAGGYAAGVPTTSGIFRVSAVAVPGAAGPWPNLWPEYGFTSGDQVSLRMSLDRGRTWRTDPRVMPLGTTGQTHTYPEWHQLGLGRDVVFEFFWNSTGQASLNGAYLDVIAAKAP